MYEDQEKYNQWLHQFRKTFLSGGRSMFPYWSHSSNDYITYLLTYEKKYKNEQNKNKQPIQLPMW